jgi:type VI secretion system secreted protein VgrG
MEAEEAAHHAVLGASNYPCLDTGGKFRLTSHPCEAEGTVYVVRRVRHEATCTSYLNQDGEPSRYDNTFEAIPDEVQFRPLRVTERPFVHGPQTAIVVGPPGEKIFTDKYGRVRVQFHWDRYGKYDDKSSCWIRVSHARAGQGWGDVSLPHVGHEVVVSFLEGDPDRPLVTGRVYNAEKSKTMAMPDNKTQSGIKDHSGNEILMEGKGGVQDVRIHAVKDMHENVDHDHVSNVANDETTTISGNRTETVVKNETITINGNRTEDVAQNESVTIGIARTHTIGAVDTLTVGAARIETVGAAETITVGAARMISVGAMQSVQIGLSHSVDVGTSESLSIGSDQTISVGSNRTISVGSDQTISVGSNQTGSVGADRSTSVGGNETLEVGKKIAISAGDEIMLKTGDATITMQKNGDITIKGKQITITGSGNVVITGQKILQN